MGFLPYFLFWGGLAAAVPVVLHFFYRSRYRVVPWAAMELLLSSIQQTSQRLRFQEVLLLLLRVALLLLLALVLALGLVRATSAWGGGGAVDAVLILDVSGSMDAREGTETRLGQAREAALAVIDRLPSASTVQIIACSDRARLLGPAAPASLGQAREILAGLTPTQLTTDFLPALREAGRALERVHNPTREVYLFSDMQRLGWAGQPGTVRQACAALHGEASRLFLVRCGSRVPASAAVVGIRPHADILYRGETASLSVLVRNTGDRPLENVSVSLELVGQNQGGRSSRSLAELLPGETRSAMLGVALPQAGTQVLRARLGADDLAGDNCWEEVVTVHDQVDVLVIDGSPSPDPERAGSFYLAEALRPVEQRLRARYSVQVRVVPPRQAFPVLLDDADLCVLADVPLRPGPGQAGGHLSAEMVQRLSRFARAGKGVLIFAGPHADPAAWNEAFLERHPLLPCRLGEAVTAGKDGPFHADPRSIPPDSVLAPLRDEPFSPLLGETAIHTYLSCTEPGGADGPALTLLRLTNGQPLVVLGRQGQGQVLLCTTSAGLAWNDWPIWGHFYLPLWRTCVNQLLQGAPEERNRTVGQPLVWEPPPERASASFLLTAPGNESRELGYPRWTGGKPVLVVEDTARAGLYRIAPRSDAGESTRVTSPDRDAAPLSARAVFAARPDVRESSEAGAMSDEEIDELLGLTPVHLRADQEDLPDEVARRRRQSWALLLGVVLALTLAETGLAWLCSRSW